MIVNLVIIFDNLDLVDKNEYTIKIGENNCSLPF